MTDTTDIRENAALNLKKRSFYILEGSVDSTEEFEGVDQYTSSTEVPQGRHLGLFSTINLFVSRMIGGGIYAVPSSIFVNCGGNLTLFFSIWVCAAFISLSGLFIFLELGTAFPKSGGRKNFLEALYDKPRMMTTVVLCSYSALTCFAMSPAIILGKYTLYALGFSETFVNEESYASNYIAIAAVNIAVLMHGFSLNRGIIIQNVLGAIKLLIVMLMCFCGLYVILFYSPPATLSASALSEITKHSHEVSAASVTAAFLQCLFCFAGWDTVHNVTSEIKNPSKNLKVAGTLSLLITLFCYSCLNLAYVKALSYDEILNAGPLIGSTLFNKLFGESIGGTFMTISIILSAASNLFVTVYGISRMNQEVFREGVLPFSLFLSRNWPSNSPLPSLLLCGITTSFWLFLLPKSGPAFDYLISFEGYGNQLLLFFVAVGLFSRRNRLKFPQNHFETPLVCAFAFILVSCFLIVSPVFGSNSKNLPAFLPSYPQANLILFLFSLLIWVLKFKILPYTFNYTLQRITVSQRDGLQVSQWRKMSSR